MTSRFSIRPRRGALLAAALALIVALIATPVARADTSGSMTVTASVTTEFSLTICDTEVNYGDGLTSSGALPKNTSDVIGVTAATSDPGQGRFYSWTPSCQVGGTAGLLEVVSSFAWKLTPCASENSGPDASPTLRIANQSLAWDTDTIAWTTYAEMVAYSNPFFRCGDTRFATIGSGGQAFTRMRGSSTSGSTRTIFPAPSARR